MTRKTVQQISGLFVRPPRFLRRGFRRLIVVDDRSRDDLPDPAVPHGCIEGKSLFGIMQRQTFVLLFQPLFQKTRGLDRTGFQLLKFTVIHSRFSLFSIRSAFRHTQVRSRAGDRIFPNPRGASRRNGRNDW